MKRARTTLIGLMLSLLMWAGCDKPQPPAKLPAVVTAVRQRSTDPTATGVIRGKVLFVGTPPVMPTIADGMCHSGGRGPLEPIKAETVAVGATGGLKNVVVYLKDASGKSYFVPPPTLDQVNCRYVPHVLAVSVGQQVTVRSSDQTLHNVHIESEHSPANLGMAGPATLERTFSAPEFVHLKCDVHPWMSAWVAVLDTPCFAVTDDDGSFEIVDVPPGMHELAVWHERCTGAAQPVTVPKDQPVNVEIKLGIGDGIKK